MNKTIAFEPLKTLSTSLWSSNKMKTEWKWSDRSMESVIQHFINLNSKTLDFLDISVKMITDGLKPALQLNTSKYVGTIPIKSPMIRIRVSYEDRIRHLSSIIRKITIEPTKEIKFHMSDPQIIKKLKKIGISILNSKSNQQIAWRMDYAEFFERYVQYLFADVAKKKNATIYDNALYNVTTRKLPLWGLSYLEPDILIQKN